MEERSRLQIDYFNNYLTFTHNPLHFHPTPANRGSAVSEYAILASFLLLSDLEAQSLRS